MVRSALRLEPLALFPCRRRPGSHVPLPCGASEPKRSPAGAPTPTPRRRGDLGSLLTNSDEVLAFRPGAGSGASMKSVRAKDGSGEPPSPGRNGERDFKGEVRTNDTHASTTDPDAKLYRKGHGQPAKLCFKGHALAENRHVLVVKADASEANGTAERTMAAELIARHAPGSVRRLTLGADKAYDTSRFVAELRRMCLTPHVAQKAISSAIDARTTRHRGYRQSQRRRKLVEEAFGW